MRRRRSAWRRAPRESCVGRSRLARRAPSPLPRGLPRHRRGGAPASAPAPPDGRSTRSSRGWRGLLRTRGAERARPRGAWPGWPRGRRPLGRRRRSLWQRGFSSGSSHLRFTSIWVVRVLPRKSHADTPTNEEDADMSAANQPTLKDVARELVARNAPDHTLVSVRGARGRHRFGGRHPQGGGLRPPLAARHAGSSREDGELGAAHRHPESVRPRPPCRPGGGDAARLRYLSPHPESHPRARRGAGGGGWLAGVAERHHGSVSHHHLGIRAHLRRRAARARRARTGERARHRARRASRRLPERVAPTARRRAQLSARGARFWSAAERGSSASSTGIRATCRWRRRFA